MTLASTANVDRNEDGGDASCTNYSINICPTHKVLDHSSTYKLVIAVHKIRIPNTVHNYP